MPLLARQVPEECFACLSDIDITSLFDFLSLKNPNLLTMRRFRRNKGTTSQHKSKARLTYSTLTY